jgi:hypothetical protein
MPIRLIVAIGLACLPLSAWTPANSADQPKISTTSIDGKAPAADACIVKYYVEKAAPDSGYETGSLHILYSDKTEVVEKLPAKRKSSEDSDVFNEEGITKARAAEDRRTIAWTEQFDNCCTSYSIPLVLAVYRSGRDIVEIQQGQMVWDWMFVDGGKRIAAVWGPVHFSDIGDYQLYDTETGRMIDEVLANAEVAGKDGTVHGLGPNAPAWAKQLESHQP